MLSSPRPPLIPILIKFGMRGGLPDMFLKFECQDDRSINVGAVGGRNKRNFPIDKANRFIQQLVATAATAQLVI